MKKIYLAFVLSLLSLSSFSQNTEFRLAFNTGLFFFNGSRVASTSFINYAPQINSYTNNPYGSLSSPIVGLAFSLKKITPYHLVFGFDLGYDFLRSGIKITGVNSEGKMIRAKGVSHINQSFVNLFPQLGYRFHANKIAIDALVGFDLALGLKLTERGHATTGSGEKYTTNTDRGNTIDFRPRLQVGVNYRKISGFLSFADGLIPYDIGEMGISQMGVYANVWRLGFAYKLNGIPNKTNKGSSL